jgi:hypothetical protein
MLNVRQQEAGSTDCYNPSSTPNYDHYKIRNPDGSLA